jgi:hypothetical protein
VSFSKIWVLLNSTSISISEFELLLVAVDASVNKVIEKVVDGLGVEIDVRRVDGLCAVEVDVRKVDGSVEVVIKKVVDGL